MKTNISFYILCSFVFLAFGSVHAQYGYGNAGRQSPVIRTPNEPAEVEPLTADEIVAREMPKIIDAIELNDFEQAVVSSVLTKYVQQSIELQLLELSPEKTKEGIEKIRENQQAELKAGLPEDKFKALQDLQKEGHKFKKGKKKKKKKSKG
jgi:isopropylmalate/homocitrate/citramalate synthase